MSTQPRCTLTATLNGRPEKRAELVNEDPNLFYFYENWTDRAALDVHLNLPYQKEWFARHDDFLIKKVELRYFSMLSDYDK